MAEIFRSDQEMRATKTCNGKYQSDEIVQKVILAD
jgi:hypothetical protein